MTQNHTDATVAAVATKVTYTASAATVIAGFTLSELAALIGIIVTVSAFFVNLYFKWKADRREQIEHEAVMRKHLGDADGR